MAEKEQQSSAYPANGGDTEVAAAPATAHNARELRKKKRTKCFLYIILFVVFQTAIITVFALTIMKVRTPKFRIHKASITSLAVGTPANPSLRGSLATDFSVKNANFGRYKYRNTTVEFFYREEKIGEVFVPNSKAGWRSTKRFIPAAVDLNLNGSPQLARDLTAGVVPITSSAQMRGRVELVFIMKKNKSTNMNCTMDIMTATQSITNIVCR